MPSKLVMMTWNDNDPLLPGNALPGAPVYPSHGLPGGPVTLPVFPFDPTTGPDNTLPATPGTPDNTLPGRPPHGSTMPIVPGARFVVKWIACIGLALVPDHTLPPTAAPK